MSEPYIYYGERTSHCCGASVYHDTDICTDCKNHCDIEEPCPDCKGTGEVDVIDTAKVKSYSIDIPYKKDKCNTCDGEGYILI